MGDNAFFSWSRRRERIFIECKKKYYNEYYGYWNGWFPESPEETKNLWLLKNLKNLPLLTWELVRDSIKDILHKFKENGEVSIDTAIKELEKKYFTTLSESKNHQYRDNPKKYFALMEDEYEIIIEQEKVDENLILAKTCLINFYKSDLFKEIKNTSKENWIFPEEYNAKGFTSFYFENTQIFAIFSLAILENNQLTVYDWTTGAQDNPEEEDIDTKNSTLLLFFMNKKKLYPNQIKIKKIYLKTNQVEETVFSNADAARIKNHIKESVFEMKSVLLDKEQNTASEENFPKTDNESNCTFCKYKKHCFPLAVSKFIGY